MEKEYFLSLDEGTSSTKAIVWDKNCNPLGIGQNNFSQIFPEPGLVEHDPEEIWKFQKKSMDDALSSAGIDYGSIISIGIANQRETTIIWDKNTGIPLYNAIVWQDRRTKKITDSLMDQKDMIKEKTGLICDPYFSASKIRWIIDNRLRNHRIEDLKFGTVDSWLLWKLTSGKIHATDYTNASRTMLFNIKTLDWDEEILELFHIPKGMLPDVYPSTHIYGYTDASVTKNEIPISSISGDQNAAFFGQAVFSYGQAKNTYGTGSFLMANTGDKIKNINNLITTIGYSLDRNKTIYAIEGSVFIAGEVIQWLKNGLNFPDDNNEIEELAGNVKDNGGLYFVPAFTGLGAPYWEPAARGLIIGITRGTTPSHIARSALESIAYQSNDIIECIRSQGGIQITDLRVDGGASVNNFLMQFQSDISNVNVRRAPIKETTSLGTCYLSGITMNEWTQNEVEKMWKEEKIFHPRLQDDKRKELYGSWKKAVERSMHWTA